METNSLKRKRGRKIKDKLDSQIEETRTSVPRGMQYILAQLSCFTDLNEEYEFSYDGIIKAILGRELRIQRDKELQEIREIPPDELSETNPHSLVSARLALPPQSISRSMTACMDQVAFYEAALNDATHEPIKSLTLFTPESFVFLSKACEELILELSCRSYLIAMDSGSPRSVHGQHLITAVRASWKTKSMDYAANGSFDFLNDVFDRDDSHGFVEPLDVIAKIHRSN